MLNVNQFYNSMQFVSRILLQRSGRWWKEADEGCLHQGKVWPILTNYFLESHSMSFGARNDSHSLGLIASLPCWGKRIVYTYTVIPKQQKSTSMCNHNYGSLVFLSTSVFTQNIVVMLISFLFLGKGVSLHVILIILCSK